MTRRARWIFIFLAFLSVVVAGRPIGTPAHIESRGTLKDPIIDSAMTEKAALDGLDPKCPYEIRKRLKVFTVLYYSFDKKVHQGQLVMDRGLEPDIKAVFNLALEEHFPIYSVIPLSDVRFRKRGSWDDVLSMDANNTSGFNFRLMTGSTRLSQHAYGRAIDINPVQNPYINGSVVLPRGARYAPAVEGTLTSDHPIVRVFKRLGWSWGGGWRTPKDYQHFEKPAPRRNSTEW